MSYEYHSTQTNKRSALVIVIVSATARLIPAVVVLALHENIGQVKFKVVQQVLGVLVDLDGLLLDERHIWDVVELLLTLLLLKFQGNAADRATLDTAHKVGNEPGNLV